MTITVKSTDENVTIILGKQLDFNSVEEFRRAYSENNMKTCIIDFRDTEYMDSSGLGMLLNMKRYLEGKTDDIKLINCRPQVKKILLISRFELKFTIS